MADFGFITINTTAEKLEKIANMEINDETLDENSSDNSLPTSKLVYNELKKIGENSGGGSGNFSAWQPNTLYKVGDVVLATWENDDAKETVIAECNEAHTSSSSFTNDVIIDAVWDMKRINAYGDEYGRRIYETYATKKELEESIGNIETALDNIIAIQEELIGGDA